MPAENARGRLGGQPRGLEIAQLGNSGNAIVTANADVCPCGCESRPPYVDEPDCIRHKPVPAPRDAAVYDVVALGLVPHDRELCADCMAVGA